MPPQSAPNALDPFRARELLERIPALVWTTDLELRITSLSGAAIATTGICREDYLYRPAGLAFEHAKPQSTAEDVHIRAIRGETGTFEMELNGREFQVHVGPLRNDHSAIVGVIGIAVDRTEWLVTQRALRISEQNYRSFLEELPHAICRCTPKGSLLQVNRAMVEMLGYSECDLLLLNMGTQIFADTAHYEEFVGKVGTHFSCIGFETQWLHNSGEVLNVSLGGRAAEDATGQTYWIDIVAENINERKQLQTHLQHAQKMQAVGLFAGGIAHDFNNLLTVIRGQIEVISGETFNGDELYRRLKEVERAAERATTLVSQLLAFSRRQVLQAKILNLNHVIASMTEMLSRLIAEDIELVFRPEPELWTVKIDPGQLEQILMNLAANARDAMPQGGQLTIETHNIPAESVARDLASDQPTAYVLLTVRDTGHGMDAATKARIFEPFFTTKEVGKGTGLGLSVVYGVVQQSGGQVSVESEPSVGTAFQIMLPRYIGTPEHTPKGVPTTVPGGTETLLLVEDNESLRNLAAEFLRDHGYHVMVAKDGLDAMKLAEAHDEIALLITDIKMPKIGGRELASKLRKYLPRLRVLLMSGHVEDSQLGTDTYFLQKPFSMLLLANTVRKALKSGFTPSQMP